MSSGETIHNESPLKVRFISTYSTKHGGVVSESLGPEALAGDLIGTFKDTIDVDHYDLQLDELSVIKGKLRRAGAEVIGVSVKIGATDQLHDIMNSIATLPNRPLVVLGGVVPTFATHEILERYPHSIITVGEAEMATRGIAEYVKGQRQLESVPGIAYIDEGELRQRPVERLDLRNLHMPARITTQRVSEELDGMVWFEGSRGCDWHCTFCSRRALRGDGFSGNIPVSHVVDDLEQLEKMGIHTAHATDDDWGGDTERTLAIANEIIARGLNIKWSMSTRADHIWQESGRGADPIATEVENSRLRYIMQRQIEAGLDRVFLGLESFSPSQLKRYGKQISVEANYKAVEVLRSLGVDVVAGYIPIDPLMSIDELKENLVGLRKTGMYKKVTNPLSVLRVQAGSPYLKLIQSRSKIDGVDYLGDKSEDLVFYNIQNFKDPRVQIVADLADKWVTEMYPLIFGLKMEVFSSTQDSRTINEKQQWSEKVLHTFRELEMKFIETLVDSLIRDEQANTEPVIAYFLSQRKHMVDSIQYDMNRLGLQFKDLNTERMFSDEKSWKKPTAA